MIKKSTKLKSVSGWFQIFAAIILMLSFPLFADAESTKQKEANAGDFVRGLAVWTDNCTRCHNLRSADEFTDLQWRPIIAHMRITAGLTGQEARDILVFYRSSN